MKTDMAHRLHSTQRLIGTRKCAQGYPANHVIRYDLLSGGPSVNSYFRCHGGPNLCCRSGAVSFSSLHFQQLMRWRAPKCWILGPTKEIRDGQSFIWKFWWNCQGSIVSIASNSSPGLKLTNFEHAARWKMQRPSPTKTCCTIWSSGRPAFLWVAFLQFWLLITCQVTGRTASYRTLRDTLWGIAWH